MGKLLCAFLTAPAAATWRGGEKGKARKLSYKHFAICEFDAKAKAFRVNDTDLFRN